MRLVVGGPDAYASFAMDAYVCDSAVKDSGRMQHGGRKVGTDGGEEGISHMSYCGEEGRMGGGV